MWLPLRLREEEATLPEITGLWRCGGLSSRPGTGRGPGGGCCVLPEQGGSGACPSVGRVLFLSAQKLGLPFGDREGLGGSCLPRFLGDERTLLVVGGKESC